MIVNLLNVSKNAGSGFQPIGLGYLMSAVRSLDPDGYYKEGQTNNLLYYNEYQHPQKERTDEKFLETTKKFEPDIILFTATTSQTRRIGKAIELLKSEGVKSLKVVGGVDAIIQPSVCLERTRADMAIVGEGPIPVKMLVAGWKDQEFPLNLIPGLIIPEPDGTVSHYKKPVYFENPDLYDSPRLPITDEEKKNGWEMTVTRSFGCPHNCPFCGSAAITKETTGHRAVRMKSEKAMLDELEYGFKNNAKSIYFADDTLFLNEKKAKSFLLELKELQQKYNKDGKIIPWIASSRIAEINRHPGLIQLAVDAGCVEIEVGKESGSDRLLKTIKNSGNYNEDLMRLMDHLKNYPTIKLGINFIIGLPGATFEDELYTIKLAGDILDRKQPVAFHIHRFAPLPGTDYWDNPEKHGLTFDKEIVMDHLSTYGVEDLIESKTLPHGQVVLIDEILNTVLRAKGAVSFRSPYLTALTGEEQAGISTFVTPGESAREIQQESLTAAKKEIALRREKLNGHKNGNSLADAVRVFESHERYVLKMEELLKLADKVINHRHKLPSYIVRESTPEIEASKDIAWYLQRMSKIKHALRLRNSNPLLRDFSKNLTKNYGAKKVPTSDLDNLERAHIFKRLEQLGRIRPDVKEATNAELHKNDIENQVIIDEEKRKQLKERLISGKIEEIVIQNYSETFSKRWNLISEKTMLGGHDFTIGEHISEVLKKYLIFAQENKTKPDDLLIGATAVMLHDIGKLGGNKDYYHPLRSAVISRKILDELGCFTSNEKKRILALVEQHALIGNLTIHGERNEYPKNANDIVRVRGREYSAGRLYAIGPITDRQYIKQSLKSFTKNPDDLDILLQIQMADTFAVKKDGSYLSNTTIENFKMTYQRLKVILKNISNLTK